MNILRKIGIIGHVPVINVADLAASKIITSSKYSPEVQEIHNEFECAADNLLKEANIILVQAEKADVVKVSRLQSLGFKQSIQVVETKPLLDAANLSTEQIKLVNYYKQNYPLQKFITEEQVKIICHKYNLVCGDVGRFRGFVPEKNLKEIEAFNLKDSEKNLLGLYQNDKLLTHLSANVIKDDWALDRIESGEGVWYKSTGGMLVHAQSVKNNIAPGFEDITYTKIKKVSNDLKICAPVKDMDISGLELEDGYKLMKKHIPDPVVLQPIKGGYLVLTKWGEEASDPILLNEIEN